jgi:large subunit ribosomal protein L13
MAPRLIHREKPSELHVIDAARRPLGRVASDTARILMGKHRAEYHPGKLFRGVVRVEHASQVVLTGRKASQKRYYRHAGKLGHLKVRKFEDVFSKNPTWILRRAIMMMLPKNRLRAIRLRRLTIVP